MHRMFEGGIGNTEPLEGVPYIINIIKHARRQVETECRNAPTNSWYSCFRSVLSVIQGEAQLSEGQLVTSAYTNRVVDIVKDIGEQLKNLELSGIVLPTEEEQEQFFKSLYALIPQPNELI